VPENAGEGFRSVAHGVRVASHESSDAKHSEEATQEGKALSPRLLRFNAGEHVEDGLHHEQGAEQDDPVAEHDHEDGVACAVARHAADAAEEVGLDAEDDAEHGHGDVHAGDD